MAPETYDEQLARELMKLGVTSRLKNAPKYHFWEIGEGKREAYKGIDAALVAFQKREMRGEKLNQKERKAYEQLRAMFYDPEINPYTQDLYNEDNETSSSKPLMVEYSYKKDFFVLSNPKETTSRIREYFYPIRWKEFEDYGDWELFREVIPAMQVARVQLSIYEEQRWLYDERSQRAAESLAYRIEKVYPRHQLPKSIQIGEQQKAVFEEYVYKLDRGTRTNARRWFQETLAKLSGTRRNRKVTSI